MPATVVDASAACALLFRESQAPQVAARLQGASLLAPGLLPFEVANVCLTKIRRSAADRDRLVASFGLLSSMNISLVDVDDGEALLLAESTGLTAYDASYLWLAEAMSAELVTLDAALAAAWAKSRRRRRP